MCQKKNAANSLGVLAGLLVSSLVLLRMPALANDAPLTPEQRAFFPKEDQLDQKLWSYFNKSMILPQTAVTAEQIRKLRYHQVFKWGQYSGVCLPWHQNQELWGGALRGGCSKLKLHPLLPHPELFAFPVWQDIDPRDHIAVIRASFLAAQGDNVRFIEEQSSDPMKYRHSSDAEAYWKLIAPIIKRMLERDGIRMSETFFDINNSGKSQHVYAITFLPKSICLKQDGAVGSEPLFLYVDSSTPDAESFNKMQVGGEPFRYAGATYFSGENGVSNVAANEPGTNKPQSTFWSQCEFEKTKR